MERPKKLQVTVPTWATTASYPAGSNPWNSNPTRVAPPVAGYFEPGPNAAAQFFNYLHGTTLDASNVFKTKLDQIINFTGQSQTLNWRRSATRPASAYQYSYNITNKMWFATDYTRAYISYDGGDSWVTGPTPVTGDAIGPSTVSTGHGPIVVGLTPTRTIEWGTTAAFPEPTIYLTQPWSTATPAFEPLWVGFSTRDQTFWAVCTRANPGISAFEYIVYWRPVATGTWTAATAPTVYEAGAQMFNMAKQCLISPQGDLWIVTCDHSTSLTRITRCSRIAGTVATSTLTRTPALMPMTPVAASAASVSCCIGPAIGLRNPYLPEAAPEQESDYSKGVVACITDLVAAGTMVGRVLLFDGASPITSWPTTTVLTNKEFGAGEDCFGMVDAVAQRGPTVMLMGRGIYNSDILPVASASPDAGASWYRVPQVGSPMQTMTVADGGLQVAALTLETGGGQNLYLYKSVAAGLGAGDTSHALGEKIA